MAERKIMNISNKLNIIKDHIEYYEKLEYMDGYDVYCNKNMRYPFSGLDEEDFYKIKAKIIEMLKECFNKKSEEMIRLCEENKK